MASGQKPDKSKATDPPNSAPQTPNSEKPARTRSAISPAKALAIVIAGLVGILNTRVVAAVLTPEQKSQVESAQKAAAEMNAKTIGPIKDRILAIKAEFQSVAADITAAGAADKAKELSQELGRLQKKLATLTQSAG